MAKILRYVLLFIVVVVVIVLIGGYITIRDWTRGPLPQHDGEISVAGLNDTVEVFRDEWGVPHIYASNPHDLFFAQGFTQAQDRWWQMEFFRHTGSGAIQELVGQNDDLMSTDIFLRTMGFREIAQQELEIAEANGSADHLYSFADGVNAYISSRSKGDLAFEYNVLSINGVDIEIEPWTPIDSLVWAKIMSLQLSGNRSSEQQRSRLAEILSDDMLNDFYPEWPFDEKPTIVHVDEIEQVPAVTSSSQPHHEAGIIGINTRLAGNFTNDSLAKIGLPTGAGIGSNNWVVSGDLSETNAPLMANDMHLGIQMPSIWYEVGLHCQPVSAECPYDVVGFALSPTPAIIAGHNANIAWALTNVGPDTQDLYQIRVNPDDDLQYEWNGEWRDMTVREETINFGDGTAPINIQVRETHLGPIINDNQMDNVGNVVGFNNDDPLALRWTALDPGTIFTAIIGVNAATNWDEFREAVSFWDTPAQNLIYADVQGNIGYQTPGRIPLRNADHSGLLPVPGWTDEFEWAGFHEYDAMPRLYNPPRDYISTANQAVVPLPYYDTLGYDDDVNPVISQQWAWGYRGDRINTLLEESSAHNIDSFTRLHGDNYEGTAPELLPYIESLTLDDAQMAELRDWLLTWDYQMSINSGQAALYASLWKNLLQLLYNDQLGDDDEAGGSETWPTILLLADPDNAWWDNASTDAVETRDDILLNAFEAAVTELQESLGEDHQTWRWGDIHTSTFVSNPLGLSGIGLLEDMVNRSGYATGGTNTAINATSWRISEGDYSVQALPSERVIYDVGDWDRSVSIHPTGQSGHPFSDHYDDMIEIWRDIEYRPMLWSREQVEAAAVSILTLVPR